MKEIIYEIADKKYLIEVKRLLQAGDLPYEDIDNHFGDFIIIRAGDKIVGSVGIEAYGNIGLLRSLTVKEEYRGKGIAFSLLRKITDHSKAKNVNILFLLTTTSKDFFLKHGFDMVSRESMPECIRQTKEFQEICPVSSVCMRKNLTDTLM